MDIQYRQFTDGEWASAAQRVGLSVAELKEQISQALKQSVHNQPAVVKITDSAQPSCKDIDFDIKVFSIKGKVCFTPGQNWKLTIQLKLFLIGIELAEVNYTFSASNLEVCYNYDIVIASLKVCFGVKGPNNCLYTKGTACAFGSCTSWDETLICFPLTASQA